MEIYKYPKRKKWPGILQRPSMETASLEKAVKKILKNVKAKGDRAVRKYGKAFDGIKLKKFLVSEEELKVAESLLSDELKTAIQTAKSNIERFHIPQLRDEEIIETMPGVLCRRISIAIEKVGLYIPGGTAPLFSTILMLGIPAKIAGCKEIILTSPPTPSPSGEGANVHPAILYTAQLVGITKIFKVGGVQAIGAMAYGTKQIPQVYKIFGPGNQYVTCAKQLVQKNGVAIDMPAGPSEVAVYADETANPAFVAADLLSQAEHGIDSHVLLVTGSLSLVEEVQNEIKKQLEQLPRKEIAGKALENSKIVLVKNEDEAMDLLNEYSPEHLILSCGNADTLAEKVVNAGSVFIGHYSPESVGDYASGTNHVLPTNGYAKAYSGVSVDSFVKKITFQKLSKEGLKNIGKTVELMAEAEGLQAHKNAVSVRLSLSKP
ncbi:MAG: histidinol dehydrogenase [Chitinophagaceae bacterium]|nr:MAG: histidinol dehydrogenase [Chitinophagaceae bacterium]